jgi:hypothetical protein
VELGEFSRYNDWATKNEGSTPHRTKRFFSSPHQPVEPYSPSKHTSWALQPMVKWPGSEADHSLPASAEVRNAWSYNFTPS